MKKNQNSHLFCLETLIVCLFFVGQLLLFGVSRLDRYDLSVYQFAVFVIYLLLYGKSMTKTVMFVPFSIFSLFVMISAYAIDGSVVDAATSETSDFSVFTYSLLGVETYFLYASYLHNHLERYKILRYLVYAFSCGGVVSYFYCVLFVMPKLDANALSDLSNIIYAIMMPLPLLLFFVKQKMQFAVLMLALIFALFTAKRMAILTLLLTILVFLLILRKKSYWITAICVAGAVAGIILFSNNLDLSIIDSVLMRFYNISEDRGSGRLSILEFFWNDIPYRSLAEFFFGHGFGQFLKTYGFVSAHNDYAEIMYAHGLFAFFCYLWINIRLYAMIWKLRTTKIFPAFLLFAIEFTIYGLTAGVFSYYTQTSLLFIMIAFLTDTYQNHTTQMNGSLVQNDP